MKLTKKLGFTLIEMMLVLGIAACFVVTVFLLSPASKFRSYIFFDVYNENNYNFNNKGDFRDFQIINENFDDMSLKIEKTSISPSSLTDSGLSNTIKNLPVRFCYDAFSKPEKLKIYYIKINDKLINKEDKLSEYCDNIVKNKSEREINVTQYLY